MNHRYSILRKNIYGGIFRSVSHVCGSWGWVRVSRPKLGLLCNLGGKLSAGTRELVVMASGLSQNNRYRNSSTIAKGTVLGSVGNSVTNLSKHTPPIRRTVDELNPNLPPTRPKTFDIGNDRRLFRPFTIPSTNRKRSEGATISVEVVHGLHDTIWFRSRVRYDIEVSRCKRRERENESRTGRFIW